MEERKDITPVRVKIIRCYGQGAEYGNCLPNSIHEVITKHNYGVTIRGVGKDVRLFPIEYKPIK